MYVQQSHQLVDLLQLWIVSFFASVVGKICKIDTLQLLSNLLPTEIFNGQSKFYFNQNIKTILYFHDKPDFLQTIKILKI